MHFTVEPTGAGHLEVDGCPIAYASWGRDDGSAPIVLVHGAAAQIGWWDGVIAALPAEYRVVALDLSGHGDSGWRAEYSGAQWADEVIAVASQIGGGPAVLVGHSLGGRVSILAAARAPEVIRELVLVDAPVRPPGGPSRRQRSRGPARRLASLEEAIATFRLRPREPVANDDLLQRVAAGSFRCAADGWSLKADRAVFFRVQEDELAAAVATVAAPITEIWGEFSDVVTEESRAFLAAAHPGPTEFIALPAHHHLIFDHCAAVAAVIEERHISCRAWETGN